MNRDGSGIYSFMAVIMYPDGMRCISPRKGMDNHGIPVIIGFE